MIKSNLQALRKKYNLTQQQLSMYVCVDQAVISRFEHLTEDKYIPVYLLDRFCRFFDCGVSDILEFVNQGDDDEDE